MKPVLSRAQMRDYDRYAVETCHVPGLVLMENAGRGAMDVIERVVPIAKLKTLVVCGEGNNGGDGFVVARHLLSRGFDVHVFLTAASEKVMGDARVNHDAYIDLGGPYTQASEDDDPQALLHAIAHADLIIDAIFGTGLRRPVMEHLAQVIDAINAAGARRIALDLPSGLDADTGAPLGATVRAHHTITFGHLKVGLLTPEGARHAGEVHVVDLGVPHNIVLQTGRVAEVMDERSVARWLSPRETNVYKHQAGSVVVIAGSEGKIGAAVLVAEAAMRAGAGLCSVATWAEAAPSIEGRAREFMTARIDRHDIEGSLDRALKHHNVAAIGPGFGLDDSAKRAVEHVVLGFEGVKVVDADAITHFAGRPEVLKTAKGKLVLTPHSGEIGRLLGIGAAEVEKDRFGAARAAAAKTGAVVLLKGARTIVATEHDVMVNVTGNAALATAGSGDVLSGILAGLACALPPDRAAGAAAFFHGLAADEWQAEHEGADRGMLASEVALRIPSIVGRLLRSRS